jgi:aromatic-L-amino-acid decarboxylase
VSLVRADPLFELVTTPSFSLSVFRINPRKQRVSGDDLNELNRLFFRKITARTDIMLTQTDINGTFCIRSVFQTIRTIHD